MIPHNTKAESIVRNETVRISDNSEDVRVLDSSLAKAAELSISEDCDQGSDPYNNTGQHVIIKSKLELQD